MNGNLTGSVLHRLIPVNAWWLLIVLSCVSCGPPQPVAAPVDARTARDTLDAVLADWKSGGTPAGWESRNPKVVVQDLDWSSGARLKGYEILGPGESRDANLYCRVRLKVEKGTQPEVEQEVTYCVGTDPVLTVFRNLVP